MLGVCFPAVAFWLDVVFLLVLSEDLVESLVLVLGHILQVLQRFTTKTSCHFSAQSLNAILLVLTRAGVTFVPFSPVLLVGSWASIFMKSLLSLLWALAVFGLGTPAIFSAAHLVPVDFVDFAVLLHDLPLLLVLSLLDELFVLFFRASEKQCHSLSKEIFSRDIFAMPLPFLAFSLFFLLWRRRGWWGRWRGFLMSFTFSAPTTPFVPFIPFAKFARIEVFAFFFISWLSHLE